MLEFLIVYLYYMFYCYYLDNANQKILIGCDTIWDLGLAIRSMTEGTRISQIPLAYSICTLIG